jgi:hypothetical protein
MAPIAKRLPKAARVSRNHSSMASRSCASSPSIMSGLKEREAESSMRSFRSYTATFLLVMPMSMTATILSTGAS